MSNQRARIIWTSVGLVASVAAGLAVNWFTQSAGWVSAVAASASATLALVTSVLATRVTAGSSQSYRAGDGAISGPVGAFGSDRELDIVGAVAILEDEARKAVNLTSDEGSYPSIFNLRAALVARGIWTEDDLKSFDEVLRMRNSLVHGDSTRHSATELREGLSVLNRLIEGLRSYTRSPRHHI
jgi:hypothetical protein